MISRRFLSIPALIIFSAMSTSTLVFSQTYGDLIEQEQNEFKKEVLEDSKGFFEEQQKDFKEFKDERDRDFAEFLKAQWEIVDFEKPMDIIEKPKPLKMPVAKLPSLPEKEIKLPSVAEDIPPDKIVKQKPVPEYVPPAAPVVKKPGPEAVEKGVPLSIDFFGTEISLRYDPAMKTVLQTPIDNKSISAFWATMARSDFDLLLNETNNYRKGLELNDWGYYMLLDKVGAKIAGRNQNEKNLFVWFMLTKSGYETKVGYRRDKVFLFTPATGNLYGISFYTLDAKRYYAISTGKDGGRLGSILTYKGKYPGADRSMDFMLRHYPKLKGDIAAKDLSFYFAGKRNTIRVAVKKNYISYFKYHPQTDVGLYAMAPLPEWMSSSLLGGLKPLIKGRSEKEAVDLLLRFTQTTFRYETDQQQFGREKVMFPEETVFYPYSDCEDRAIFFSYLVRDLLRLDVVLLNYPNHIATAVRFKGRQQGDQVRVNGTAYTICDPTYINSVSGMAMPQFKGIVPKVIII